MYFGFPLIPEFLENIPWAISLLLGFVNDRNFFPFSLFLILSLILGLRTVGKRQHILEILQPFLPRLLLGDVLVSIT